MSSPFPLPHFAKVETSAMNLISGPNDVNFCHFLLRTPAAKVNGGGKAKKRKSIARHGRYRASGFGLTETP